MTAKEWFAVKFLDTNKPKFQVRVCPYPVYDHVHDIEYNNCWGYFGWSKIRQCGEDLLTGYPMWFDFSLDIMRHTIEWHLNYRFDTLEKIKDYEKEQELEFKLITEREYRKRKEYSDKLSSLK